MVTEQLVVDGKIKHCLQLRILCLYYTASAMVIAQLQEGNHQDQQNGKEKMDID